MRGSIRAAWLLLRRPTILWPAIGATVLFTIASIAFTFVAAAAPGGSRITDPPLFLGDLASAGSPEMLVGRPVMVLGLVCIAVSAMHVSGQFGSGSIRIQLIRQPRRRVWLAGTWITLALAAATLSVITALVALATGWICAGIMGVDTSAWGSGLSGLLGAVGNLALGMIAFALAGSALAVWLRSAVVTLTVGLVYALFETLLNSVIPVGQGLLPASAFSTVATSGASGGIYADSLVATLVILGVILTGVSYLFAHRDVTD